MPALTAWSRDGRKSGEMGVTGRCWSSDHLLLALSKDQEPAPSLPLSPHSVWCPLGGRLWIASCNVDLPLRPCDRLPTAFRPVFSFPCSSHALPGRFVCLVCWRRLSQQVRTCCSRRRRFHLTTASPFAKHSTTQPPSPAHSTAAPPGSAERARVTALPRLALVAKLHRPR